jgi:type IV pilus assembly protein PilM
LSKHVRLGIANQRTVMRTLELPPVTDRKELAAAVRFLAQDQVPMPLNNAVLDFHPLGVVETPAGPRQRVVLVAAQRDMVEQLLAAVRGAGLTPDGVDLSAFALIRSLHHRDGDQSARVLYLNVDGLTNLAIADGTTCRFTRVVGGGLEAMAAEIAERQSIPLTDARALLYDVDLAAPAAEQALPAPTGPEPAAPSMETEPAVPSEEIEPVVPPEEPAATAAPVSPEDHEAREIAMGYSETIAAAQAAKPEPAPPAVRVPDAEVRSVLERGVREISGEVRNSLDFHRSQEEGGEVSHVVLSGAVLDLPGFAGALQESLGIDVRSAAVELLDAGPESNVSTSRLAVAAGLATVEAPQ